MNRRHAASPARAITAEAAAGLVKSGMWLDYGAVLAQPDCFDRALARRAAELHEETVWHRAIIERAKLVIVETCSTLPYCYGVDNAIHISEVDYIVEGDNAPVFEFELPKPALTDVDRAVSRHIAAEIEDGACLQIGIGGMPNAVCSLLLESGVRNLGVHTETLTDGIVDLYKAGLVTGAAKTLDVGQSAFCFALGSRYLYDTIDHNRDFVAYATRYTNLPHIIMQNDKAVSINNTTQMDLQGQAASESDGHRHMYVVTEYGCVNLKGKSVAQRAKAMISLAHPDFREGLERQAHEYRLIPRGFTL